MYNEKLVVAVKCNGEVLREYKDIVYLPVGTEYSLLIKNLNSRKALVSVDIDGQDVLGNKQIIIDANSEVELERFLDDLNSGNKFRFIEKTQKISDYRGDRAEDGIVRIEYQFEREVIEYPKINWNWNGDYIYPSDSSGTITSKNYDINTNSVQSTYTAVNCCCQDEVDGITVKGSESNQKFIYGNIGELEDNKHVICIKLVGKKDNKPIYKPVMVNTKLQCEICGTKNNSRNKFCRECGSALF